MTKAIPKLGGVLLALGIMALAPGEAEAQYYYADCDICAQKLGGLGRAGPYTSWNDCNNAIQIMRSQGFPFDPCYGPVGRQDQVWYPGPGASFGIKAALLSGLFGAGGGASGWAFSAEADKELNTRKAAIAGAAVGWVIALALQQPDTPRGEQPMDAMLAAAPAVLIAHYSVEYFSNAPPEEKKRQQALADVGAVVVAVAASFTLGKKLSSDFREGDTGRSWKHRIGLSLVPTYWPDQGSGWAAVVTIRW